jgi:GNAT superfamily N-acetyltransferase
MVEVRPLQAADAEACMAIMRRLSDFFGYEPGLEQAAKDLRSQEGWVAVAHARPAGFATWTRRSDATAEITWMAVESERRHQGIGTAIVERLVADLEERGFALALAMTSAGPKPADPSRDTYGPTRAFWKARGFHPLIELDIWETDFALLQVRPLIGA